MYENRNIICGPFKATRLWNEAVRTFYNEMPIRKHWRGLKQYENCFTGREAVDCIKEYLTINPNYGSNITRGNATKLLSKFLQSNVIISISESSKENFSDNRELYRFSDQSPLRALRSPCRPPLLPRTANSLRTPLYGNHQRMNDYAVLTTSAYKEMVSDAALWTDVLFNRLKEVSSRLIVVCDSNTTIVPKSYINGDWVWKNVINGRNHHESNSILENKELPSWIIAAMKTLENYTGNNSTESICDLPSYPGVEIDVFKVVRDYFTNMVVPMISYELYEPIVKQFIGAEFLDIANRSPTPRHKVEDDNLTTRASMGSVEDLMLDLSINATPANSPDVSTAYTKTPIYETLQRNPTSSMTKSVSIRSVKLPDDSAYANFKDSRLYLNPESDKGSKDNQSRLTLRSLKNKVKHPPRKLSQTDYIWPLRNKAKHSPDRLSQTDYIRSDQLENLTLPPNSCFETAFTSDSPITRIIPQKAVDTIHYSLCRVKRKSENTSTNHNEPTSSKSSLLNAHINRGAILNKSLSENNLLHIENETVTKQNLQNHLKRNSSKTLASRVRDSLKWKKSKYESKRSDRRPKRFMSAFSSGNNSTDSLLSASSFNRKNAILGSNRDLYTRFHSVENLGSDDNRSDSGFVNHRISASIDDDTYSTDSKSSWKRNKHSPAFSSSDTLIYSVRSGNSCKVSTPVGCLSHSIASAHSSYSARSNLNVSSNPESKTTDLLDKSLNLSNGFNTAADVSLIPALPRRVPLIIRSPLNVTLNQLTNDYENVTPIPRQLSSSASNLTDTSRDRAASSVIFPIAKEGMLEHYSSSPSKKLLTRTPVNLGSKNCFSGLLTTAGKEFCTEALQLILLLMAPEKYQILRRLLKMTRRVAENRKIQFHPEMDNRTLMVNTLCRTVFVSKRENYDENLSVRIVSFLMDFQDTIFSPPTELLIEVHERQKCFEDKNGVSYCQQVSLNTYEKQKLSGAETHLCILLDQIIEAPHLSSKERSKKLKEFRQHYPHIYRIKFPDVAKKAGNFKKLSSMNMLSKTKSFRI